MADLFNANDRGEEELLQAAPADGDEVLSVEEEDEGEGTALPQEPELKEEKKKNPLSDIFDVFETFCYALVLMMILFVFVFRFVTVEGGSMTHTLENQDKLIISDLFYEPQTGDIVVINTEGVPGLSAHKYIIKRVIATGGQTVNINFDKWKVTVDGVALNETYVRRDNMLAQMEGLNMSVWKDVTVEADGSVTFVVPEDTVFAMGDNRNGSSDGRHVGCLEEERIIGRVLLRVSPEFGRV